MTGVPEQQSLPLNGDDVRGAPRLLVDARVGSLIVGQARKGAVTRMFGVPPADQSLLATLILFGAAAAVLRDLTPRPWRHATGVDARIGASLVKAAFRGLAGPPSATMPLAGGLIAVAVCRTRFARRWPDRRARSAPWGARSGGRTARATDTDPTDHQPADRRMTYEETISDVVRVVDGSIPARAHPDPTRRSRAGRPPGTAAQSAGGGPAARRRPAAAVHRPITRPRTPIASRM